GARRLTQERLTIFRHDQRAGRRRARRDEGRQTRKPLRLRSWRFVDHFIGRQTSRDDYSAKAPAQFCLGRRRWKNALPLCAQRTLPDEVKHRGREAVVVSALVGRAIDLNRLGGSVNRPYLISALTRRRFFRSVDRR